MNCKSILPVALAACTLTQVYATTVSASAGGLFNSPGPNAKAGSATWTFSVPTVNNTITWTSGPDYADGQEFVHNPPLTENKFGFTGLTPKPVAAYTGIATNDCSTGITSAGSCATTKGTGSSAVGRISDTASWNVTAGGTLGAGVGASYDSTITAKDPWTLSSSDFTGMSGQYSLFFTFSVTSASISANGSAGLDVNYATSSVSDDLLDVALNFNNATVSTPYSTNVSIFELPAVETDPNTLNATPLTPAQLQSLFQGDLSGGSLSAPITLGFLLNDLDIPTVDMGGGVLAQVSESATANDNAAGSATATPEPSTLSIALCGAILLGLSRCLSRGRA